MRGSQKGGGGGSDIWETFPKIPLFFLDGVPKLIKLAMIMMNKMNDLEQEKIHLGRLPTFVHLLVDGKNSSVLDTGVPTSPFQPLTIPPATSIACSKYKSQEIGQDLDTGTSSP